MKISPLNFLKTNNIKYSAYNSSNLKLKSLDSDIVSFSSNYSKNNPRSEDAANLGYEIYYNLLTKQSFNPQKFISRKVRNVQILPIEELRKERVDGINYCAYCSCEYDDEIMPTDLKLYIGDKPKNFSAMANLLYSMTLAHEYTHLLQAKDGLDNEFLKELSKGDKEYLLLLNGLSGAVFSVFDNDIQAKFVSSAMDFTDALSSVQYDQIAPREKEINEAQLLSKNGFKDAEHFNKVFNDLFDVIYEKVFDKLNYNSRDVEARVKNAFISYLAKEGSLVDLKKDIRKYCAHLAKTEFEAYSTESNLAKKALRTSSRINIDAFPMYYDMLNKAFES